MFLVSLTTAVLGCSAPIVRAQDDCSLGALHDAASLTIRVEETRFVAQSAGREPALLAFAVEGRAPAVFLWLPPGARIESSFPRGAAHDLSIEVVQRFEERWVATGALALALAPLEGTSATLVFPSGAALQGDGASFTLVQPVSTLLPERARAFVALPSRDAAHALPAIAPAPWHVPVPQPTSRPTADRPPKLEEKPLPPV